MSGRLRIERLELRLRGATRAQARAAVSALGPALLERLGEHAPVRAAESTRIDTLDAAAVDAAALRGADTLHGELARAAATALAPHLPQHGKR